MWDGDIAALRYQYLFLLAHVCHIGPDQSRDMRVIDFGLLIHGIDGWIAANKPAEG